MATLNMQDDIKAEAELNALTATDEEGISPEEVLGSVHLSKATVSHVMWLLRPLVKPVLEQINRTEQKLQALVNDLAKSRVFDDTRVAISANVGYQVDYLNRKYLYIMTSNPNFPILQVNGVSVTPGIEPNVWYPLHYPRGSTITVAGQSDASPITFTVRACDEPQALYTYSLYGGQVGIAAGGNAIGYVGIEGQNSAGGQDKWNSNLDNITLITASGVTTTQTSADQTNINARGCHVWIYITALTAGSVTVTIQGKDPVSGQYLNILTSPALSATGFTALEVGPGIAVAANIAQSTQLPRTWRVQAAVATGPASFTVSTSLHV